MDDKIRFPQKIIAENCIRVWKLYPIVQNLSARTLKGGKGNIQQRKDGFMKGDISETGQASIP